MLKNHKDKRNMPFFDAFKTTAAIGLLMQQTAALHCPEGPLPQPSFYAYQQRSEGELRAVVREGMEESLGFIQELTAILQKGYSILAESSDESRDSIIRTLDPTQAELVELQLRGLEGGLRNVYKNCAQSESDKEQLKPYLIIIAKARSAAANLNHLISQMTKQVDTFESAIDVEGLQALARHGTEVFLSDRFH